MQNNKFYKYMIRLITIAALLLSIIACQPTPETDAVRQKNDHKLVDVGRKEEADARPLRKQVNAPERYANELNLYDGRLKVLIDASVEIPNETKIPIVKVEAADFTQDQVYTFFRYFCGDREMYNISNDSVNKKTVESEIRYLMQEISELEKAGKSNEPYTEQCRAALQYYESIYADAPDPEVPERCDGTLKKYTRYSPKSFKPVVSQTQVLAQESAEEYAKKGYVVQFSVQNRDDLKQSVQVDGEWFIKNNTSALSFGDLRNSATGEQSEHKRITDLDAPTGFSLSPREAIEAAQAFLKEIGLSDQFAIDSVTLYHNPGTDPNLNAWEEYSYQVRLTRVVSGIPCAYNMIGVKSEYAGVWAYEEMYLYVDDKGIFEFDWFAPMHVTETILEETELLPFDKIMKLFESQVQYSVYPPGEGFSKTYYIDRITLSLQRVLVADDFEQAMLVPVWSFYGTFDDQNSYETRINADIGGSLVTINAIDGTIIDLHRGY